jgi:hypothetical protein
MEFAMAYNNAQKSNSFQGKSAGNSSRTTAAPVAAESASLFTTGLFKSEKGPALASVKVKEDILIPAGAYINLYEVDEDRKTDTGPVYRIQIRKVDAK